MVDRLLRGTSTVTLFKTASLFAALIFALLVVPQDGIAQNATPTLNSKLNSISGDKRRSSAHGSRASAVGPHPEARGASQCSRAKGHSRTRSSAGCCRKYSCCECFSVGSNAERCAGSGSSHPTLRLRRNRQPRQSHRTTTTTIRHYGRYTPNFGFKVVNTEYGDMNVSIYTYARYLNQRGLASTYTDAFGNTKSVQERQDFQLNKMQIKFLGWIMNPKLRYFLYAWTSNANQGLGAQVVLAGNLNYTFNKHFTLSGGITGLPGTRSIEGNFPFWLGVDSRLIADEFFRGSYTSGIWARGDITDKLKYQVMLGNNLSTLGVPASRIDNQFQHPGECARLDAHHRGIRTGLWRLRGPSEAGHSPGVPLQPER